MRQKIQKSSGYTLLETLIAFVILLVIVVPLVSFLFRISGAHDSERMFTGICLMEQEAALVRAFPGKSIPVKMRIINGREWVIKTEVGGSELLQYKMRVSEGEKMRGEVMFYGRRSKLLTNYKLEI